jgi:hypothetical protein
MAFITQEAALANLTLKDVFWSIKPVCNTEFFAGWVLVIEMQVLLGTASFTLSTKQINKLLPTTMTPIIEVFSIRHLLFQL